MGYFIGIDIGTTAVKSVAMDAGGQMLYKSSLANKTWHPQPGYAEQDAEEVLALVKQSVNEVIMHMGKRPEWMALSAAMHGLLLTDEQNNPMGRCITWADNRAWAEAAELKQLDHDLYYYRNSGVPHHAMSPLCKLRWLGKHQPEQVKNAFKVADIKAFIVHRFTGYWITDTSMASATGYFNIHQLNWEDELLEYAGIQKTQLPEIAACDRFLTISHYAPLADIPLMLGGSDGAMACYATHPQHCISVSIGTSAAARMLVTQAFTPVSMELFCYHVIGKYHMTGGASNNGASALQWWHDSVLQKSDNFGALLQEAASIPAGSEGLLFLPYLSGERAPHWNAQAKGAFVGVQAHHRQAHFTRAVMEGVVLNLCIILDILNKTDPKPVLQVAGGFAASPLWMQMLADASNKWVELVEHEESAAWGTVKLGLEKTGAYRQPAFLTTTRFVPNAGAHAAYAQILNDFKTCYSGLHSPA